MHSNSGNSGSNHPLAVSADDVAAMLGISRAHVWRLLSSGKLPRPVRLGRSVRWQRSTIEAWLEAGAPPMDEWEAHSNI